MRKNISSHKKPRELLPGALSTFMKYCAFFSHPDFTVGSGISPDRLTIAYTISVHKFLSLIFVHRFLTRYPPNDQFADFTAGWELHPAPKNLLSHDIIIRYAALRNYYFVLISRISFLIGSTNVGDTDSSSIPILRNVSVRVISAPSSPQIPTQHPALCPFSIVCWIMRSTAG